MSDKDQSSALLQNVKGLLWNGREDILGLHAIAQRASMDQLMHRNVERQFALSDAQMKRCNPDYTPPERDEEMPSPVFINAGIMGDEITQKISNMLASEKNESSEQTAPASPDQQRVADLERQLAALRSHVAAPARAAAGGLSSLLWDGAMKMLPLLAVAGLSIAAARYFTPKDTDTNSQYSIEAQPYTPESTVPG